MVSSIDLKFLIHSIFYMSIAFKKDNFFFIDCSVHQQRLLKKLFSDYDPVERPVKNENDTLEVQVALSVQRLVDLVCINKLFKQKE